MASPGHNELISSQPVSLCLSVKWSVLVWEHIDAILFMFVKIIAILYINFKYFKDL